MIKQTIHDQDRSVILIGWADPPLTAIGVAGFWREQIIPRIHRGERILISAHGNTLRALIMELAGMGVEEVGQFEIPTATPILYRVASDGRALDWRYLGSDLDAARSA